MSGTLIIDDPVTRRGLPYRAGLSRRELRNLRRVTGYKKPGKVRAAYDAGVRDSLIRSIPTLSTPAYKRNLIKRITSPSRFPHLSVRASKRAAK